MRKYKYFVLTLLLVAVLVAQSLAGRAARGAVVDDVFVTILAMAVFAVVFQRQTERIVAFVTAAASIAISWARHLPIPQGITASLEVADHVLHAAFFAFAVGVILRNIFEAQAITKDDILGTVCGYLLAAEAWANVHALTAILVPGSFAVTPALNEIATAQGRTTLFSYFSVVTMATMGYGDVTPVRAPATVFAMLEAIFGQFYLAVVVAQLVGLRLAQAIAPSGRLSS
jgi:hypothetical protein